MLVSSLIDDNERVLAKYQKQNALDVIVDENYWEDKIDYKNKDFPTILEKNDTLIQKHKKENEEFFTNYMEEKFKTKDYRLLKGIFTTKPMSNIEVTTMRKDKQQLKMRHLQTINDDILSPRKNGHVRTHKFSLDTRESKGGNMAKVSCSKIDSEEVEDMPSIPVTHEKFIMKAATE